MLRLPCVPPSVSFRKSRRTTEFAFESLSTTRQSAMPSAKGTDDVAAVQSRLPHGVGIEIHSPTCVGTCGTTPHEPTRVHSDLARSLLLLKPEI